MKKASKSYWSLLKILLNNEKIPLIPPLFHSNRFILDFKHKAELFNDFFSNQCSLINNNSKLPTNLNHVTDRRLSSVTSSAGDIKLFKFLIQTKRMDMTIFSIRMLKICGDTINEPLELMFKKVLITGIYPSDWKKGKIVPVHKKGDK